VPAGSLDPGETPEDGAVRECEEEIRLVPGRLERIGGLYPAPGFCDEELIFFKAFALGPPAPDSTRQPDEDE
jgi:ADP-ribose pyrophosphatase